MIKTKELMNKNERKFLILSDILNYHKNKILRKLHFKSDKSKK